jgi:hypothetical protein
MTLTNFVHVIYSQFTRPTRRDMQWWKHRLQIFENFTIQSLKNQTNQNFYFVLYVCKKLPDILLPEFEKVLKNSKLKSKIVYIEDENKVKKELNDFLPISSFVYATRIDSDDLLHKDATSEIQQHCFAWRRALVFQAGYYYDCVDNRMRHHLKNSPPFHTIMYPYDIYLDLTASKEYRQTSGHDTVQGRMNSVILSENKYMLLLHGRNNSGRYSEPDKKGFEPIEKEKYDDILKDFGVSSKTYQTIKVDI